MKVIELIDYFPSKLAKGKQFCNRIAEQKTLKRNRVLDPLLAFALRKYS